MEAIFALFGLRTPHFYLSMDLIKTSLVRDLSIRQQQAITCKITCTNMMTLVFGPSLAF